VGVDATVDVCLNVRPETNALVGFRVHMRWHARPQSPHLCDEAESVEADVTAID